MSTPIDVRYGRARPRRGQGGCDRLGDEAEDRDSIIML